MSDLIGKFCRSLSPITRASNTSLEAFAQFAFDFATLTSYPSSSYPTPIQSTKCHWLQMSGQVTLNNFVSKASLSRELDLYVIKWRHYFPKILTPRGKKKKKHFCIPRMRKSRGITDFFLDILLYLEKTWKIAHSLIQTFCQTFITRRKIY